TCAEALARRGIKTAVVFVAAKRAALVPVADPIGRQFFLRLERGGGEIFGATGRAIAVAEGRLIVPPAARVIGAAEEDLVAQIRVLEADADELHQVLRADPDGEPALVDRRVGEIADADAGHAQAVLIGIERAERLAEGFADAVARIRAHRLVGADLALARIKTDRMVRRGEDDALDFLAPRRLEQIVAADDIGAQDAVPRLLDRLAAEMDDAVDALDQLFDLGEVGEIGLDERLAFCQTGRRADVAPANIRIDAVEQLAQPRTDATRCARHQNCLHDALDFFAKFTMT